MGLQFHETGYGKRFFDVQLPSLIKALNRVADANEKQQPAEPAVEVTANMVYVCYEENSNELGIENGAVNEMYVAASLNDVYKWLDKRLKEAEQNFYTVLNDMEESEFYKELMASKECALHLYHNGDENSRLNYALTVKPFTSANGLYPKGTGETYDGFALLWQVWRNPKSLARSSANRLSLTMNRIVVSDTISQKRFWMTVLKICS